MASEKECVVVRGGYIGGHVRLKGREMYCLTTSGIEFCFRSAIVYFRVGITRGLVRVGFDDRYGGRVVKALDLSSNGRMSAWVRTPPVLKVLFF